MGLVDAIRIIALFLAAVIVGNWFLSEVKKAKAEKAVWYKPYISPPGIIIIVAVIGLPILIWFMGIQ